LPVRDLDGLRGVHDHAHARGVRRNGRHAEGDRARSRTDGEARHQRRARPHVRVLLALDEPRAGHQAVRNRARGRHRLRRPREPPSARTVVDAAPRPLELVAADLDGTLAPHAAEPPGARARRSLSERRPPSARGAVAIAAARRNDAPMERPWTKYAWNGDVALAYQPFGNGELDLLYLEGWAGNIDVAWESPYLSSFLRGLGEAARVVFMDRRGRGLSERFSPDAVPPFEILADDMLVVLDAVGVERAVVMATNEA